MARRLAAVLIADVAGYSRLSHADEEDTRARFQGDLREVFEPALVAHHGRLVKTMGDALLVEFASVVDALRWSIAVQRLKAERNIAAPADRRLEFRIGINLGDVIVEGDDIHGDGVNIAARLQGLADPGGIAISGAAYDQVKGKLAVGYADLGVQPVKGIAEPVRVYRVLLDGKDAGRLVEARTEPPPKRYRRWHAAAAGLLLLILAAVAAAWLRPWEPGAESKLPLPDNPSIAVLPFANMSGDPGQEYFADGMTDDLTTSLSKIAGLFVIARNSSFTYKGKSVDVRRVAEELGVRYVLEGSIQRSSQQLRISAQLIDASTGGHVWADRFDGSMADVFALQDRVTREIADALALRLAGGEQQDVRDPETKVPAAYDAFLRGWGHYRRFAPADLAASVPHFETAIRLDPNYARANAALAMVYLRSIEEGVTSILGITAREARSRAKRHVDSARMQAPRVAHQVAGYLLALDNRTELAVREYREAIALDPGDSWTYALMAQALISSDRSAEALDFIDTALRLDPYPPAAFLFVAALADFDQQRYAEAAAALQDVVRLAPDNAYPYIALAAVHGLAGRRPEAESAVARYNELIVARGGVPITMENAYAFRLRGDGRERFFQGLRAAGVPQSFLDGDFGARNKASAAESAALFAGKGVHGRDLWSGEERAASAPAGGTLTLSGEWPGFLSAGGQLTAVSVQATGDQVCFAFGTAKQCGILFRNPGGSRAAENQYFWYNADAVFEADFDNFQFGVATFSPVD